MGLFSRSSSTSEITQMRDTEARTAETCRGRAAEATATGQPVRGIDADGWNDRANTFQAAADGYQKQLDNRRR